MKSFKTNLKLLVAATALAAAVPAGATINNVGTTSDELFLTVWNTTTNTSYTRDLGLKYVNFNPTSANTPTAGTVAWDNTLFTGTAPAITVGTNNLGASGYTLSFAADNTLATLLATSGTVWNVSGLLVGATSALLTTVGSGSTASVVGQQLDNAIGNAQTFVTGVNGLTSSSMGSATGTNGSATATSASADAQGYGPTSFGNLGLTSLNLTGTVGNSLSFYQLTDANGAANSVVSNLYAGTWTLGSNGILSYSVANTAPIPEPGTWAMLIAGLMMVGGIARRRTSV